MLKYGFLKMSLAALLFLQGATALAADTSMNISGKVIAAACTVDTNLASGMTVDLGTLGRTKFQLANSAGDWVLIKFALSNCPPGTSSSTVTLTGTPDATQPTLFANTEPAATAATNMAIQVVDGDQNTVLSNNSSVTSDVEADMHTAAFSMWARLYTPRGGVQAGKVTSVVLLNFTYQ